MKYTKLFLFALIAIVLNSCGNSGSVSGSVVLQVQTSSFGEFGRYADIGDLINPTATLSKKGSFPQLEFEFCVRKAFAFRSPLGFDLQFLDESGAEITSHQIFLEDYQRDNENGGYDCYYRAGNYRQNAMIFDNDLDLSKIKTVVFKPSFEEDRFVEYSKPKK